MAEANPSKGDSGRTAPEQRKVADEVATQEREDAQSYDESRREEVKRANESKELGKTGFVSVGGVIKAGTANTAATHFPGAERRGLDDSTPDGAFLKAYAEKRDSDEPQVGWTVQSSGAYADEDASSLPGQTYSLDELPDADVLAAAGVAYTIPANLVVDGNVTDNISSAQERAGTQKTSRGDGSADKRTADKTSATSM